MVITDDTYFFLLLHNMLTVLVGTVEHGIRDTLLILNCRRLKMELMLLVSSNVESNCSKAFRIASFSLLSVYSQFLTLDISDSRSLRYYGVLFMLLFRRVFGFLRLALQVEVHLRC